MKNPTKVALIFLFSLVSFASHSGELEKVMPLYDESIRSLTGEIFPAPECNVPFLPPPERPPQFNEISAQGMKRSEEKEITGEDLIKRLKRRLESSNYEGKDGIERCTVEIEKKGDDFDVVVKAGSASSQTRWIKQEDLKTLPPGEEDRFTIKGKGTYLIETHLSKGVVNVENRDIEYKGYQIIGERVLSHKGRHMFFSWTSPNFPGHHMFEYDFFVCHFKASLY